MCWELLIRLEEIQQNTFLMLLILLLLKGLLYNKMLLKMLMILLKVLELLMMLLKVLELLMRLDDWWVVSPLMTWST